MCGFVNIIFGYLYILNSFEYSEFVYVLLQKTYWTPIFFREVDRHTVPVQFSEENKLTPVYMIYLYYESKFHYNPSLKQDLLYCVVCNFYLFLVIHYTYHFSSQSQRTILCFRMYVVKCPLFILRVGVW